MLKFDWYTASIHGEQPESVVGGLVEGLEFASPYPCTARFGYLRGVEIRRGERVLAAVWWGGNAGVCVSATGSSAPEVAELLRARWPDHRVSRVDVAVDFVQEGLFDDLARQAIAFAVEHGLTINQQGDWERGKARTLYIGSPESPHRLVIYEKGYEAGGSPHWVRIESRTRPKGNQGYKAARMSERELFAPAKWQTELFAQMGYPGLEATALGTVWKPSDELRARQAMLKQYHRVLTEIASQEGSWEAVGPYLRDALDSMGMLDSNQLLAPIPWEETI